MKEWFENATKNVADKGNALMTGAYCRVMRSAQRVLDTVHDRSGQGTTEYAILVGVLVVIAIIAVVAFRGKLQELWSSISDGINGL